MTTNSRLAVVAQNLIRNDILGRRLLPGAPLLEGVLADKYNMSKTPVREALVALSKAGLVDSVSRRWYVRHLDVTDAREIYQLQLLIEPTALREAARFLTADDLANLRAILGEARGAIDARDLLAVSAANGRFHAALISRCPNRRMVEFLVQLRAQLAAVALNTWGRQPTYLPEAAQHESIVAALEKGDVELAVQNLRQHILDGQRDRGRCPPAAAVGVDTRYARENELKDVV